ncbi:hypothetical protein BDV06DRAFT_221913 [Aspergillus oleicola]
MLVCQDYPCPLLAALLAHCPNLIRLHLHVDPADEFLRRILSHAITRASPSSPATPAGPAQIVFQNLETLALHPPRSHREPMRQVPKVSLHPEVFIGAQDPYYFLPKLKNLIVLAHHTHDRDFNPRKHYSLSQVMIESNITETMHQAAQLSGLTLSSTTFQQIDLTSLTSTKSNLRRLNL